MKRVKTLVIGNSGAGKTSCIELLATNKQLASMDHSLPTDHYIGIEKTLKWVLEDTHGEPIIASSAHEDLFWDLARLRASRSSLLDRLLIIYLYTSIPAVRYERLKSSGRSSEAQATPMAWDPLLNNLGQFIADVTINTNSMTSENVARLVKAISDSQLIGTAS